MPEKPGKPADALPDVQRSLELDPENPNALDTIGHILVALGRQDEAVMYLQQAATLAPFMQSPRDLLKQLGATVPPAATPGT